MIAVWGQQDGNSSHLYANRSTPENGWGTVEQLYKGTHTRDSNNFFVHSASPMAAGVAVARNGDAMAYWTETEATPDKVTYRAYVRYFTPLTGWAPPQRIDTGGIGGIIAQVAFDRHGKAMALMGRLRSTSESAGMGVYTRRFSPTDGWESEESMGPELGTATVFNQLGSISRGIQIAFAPNDTAIAVWNFDDGEQKGSQVFASRYIPGHGWSRTLQVGPRGGNFPQLAFDGDSNATLVWRVGGRTVFVWGMSGDGTGIDKIYAARFTSAGVLESPQLLAERSVRPVDQGALSAPLLAVNSNGDAIATWTTAGTNATAARYTPGTGWGAPQQFYAGSITGGLPVAIDPSGNAVAVWTSYSGSKVNGIRYSTSGGWGPVHSFIPDMADVQFIPAIVLDRAGQLTVIWAHDDWRVTDDPTSVLATRINIFEAR
jgi:hypothetical protein